MIRRSLSPFLFLLSLVGTALGASAVTISEAQYEERPQFVVRTSSGTYFYDCAGGGFSRLLDREGRDWIAFRKEPLQDNPASAAAGFRGIPNSVFGKGNTDAGAGHPGFDKCESRIDGVATIRTVSKSGRWAWRWDFTEENATLTIEKADPDHPYWFLYEGPVGGKWSPRTHYWGTNLGGPRLERPSEAKESLFAHWQWVYFGDEKVSRVLLAVQVKPDKIQDTLWYMASSRPGGLDAPDGMIVFGFGRGPGSKPLLRGAGLRFVIGLVERKATDKDGHGSISKIAADWIRQSAR